MLGKSIEQTEPTNGVEKVLLITRDSPTRDLIMSEATVNKLEITKDVIAVTATQAQTGVTLR